MAVSLGLREVRRVSGRIYVRFQDKAVIEFNSVAELRAFATSVEEDPVLLRKLLLLYWLKRNDGSDASGIEGKRVTLDLASATLLDVA